MQKVKQGIDKSQWGMYQWLKDDSGMKKGSKKRLPNKIATVLVDQKVIKAVANDK